MSEVQRICPHCGEAGPLAARYCPHCGADSQAALPAPQANFPLALTKAALPILAAAQRPHRTSRIRSAWSVTDGNGVHRSGVSEHQIEIDD